MKSADFWNKKRQEMQPQQPVTNRLLSHNSAWWQENQMQAPQIQQQLPDEHDFSKATSLKSLDKCPNCYSGNYVKSSASVAARCFDCGYIDGRQVNDLDTMAITADVATVKVRQAASAHGSRIGHTAASINEANANLARSEQGKGTIK